MLKQRDDAVIGDELEHLLKAMCHPRSKLTHDGAVHVINRAIKNAIARMEHQYFHVLTGMQRASILARAEAMLADIRMMAWIEPIADDDMPAELNHMYQRVLEVLSATGLDDAMNKTFRDALYTELEGLEQHLITGGALRNVIADGAF